MGQHVSGLSVRHPFASVLASRSHPTRSGRGPIRSNPRFATTCATAPSDSASASASASGARSSAPNGTSRRGVGGSRPRTGVHGAVPDRRARAAQRAVDPRRSPGWTTSQGIVFHTARWNHDHDLTGRNVAVIGTGASAIQTVPMIQPDAKHITIFQRTAPWVVPHRRPSDHRVRAAPVPPRSGGAASRADLGVRRPRAARHRARLPAGADEHRAEVGARGIWPNRSPTRRSAPS